MIRLPAQVAAQYDTTFYPSLDELSQCDAVIIATPTSAHFRLAMQCLAQGIHLLIEKPITTTVAEAEALVAAATAAQLVVQVGHIERFNPTYTELKHVLDDIQIAAINFRRLSPYVGSNTDVDVVLDLMIHDLDLVLDLMQAQPTAIHAVGLAAFSGDIDHAVTQLTFPAGPLVTMMVSRLTEQKIRAIDVTGLEAYVEGDLLNKSIFLHRSMTGEYLNYQHSVKYRQESMMERLHVPMAEPLFLELQHFVGAILGQHPLLVTAQDGLQALQLANQIRTAIRQDLRLIQPPSEQQAHIAWRDIPPNGWRSLVGRSYQTQGQLS
ncbi:MAG: Gfo/Idh/MocA family oxidoreductase [Caldilineaceae bacterium]